METHGTKKLRTLVLGRALVIEGPASWQRCRGDGAHWVDVATGWDTAFADYLRQGLTGPTPRWLVALNSKGELQIGFYPGLEPPTHYWIESRCVSRGRSLYPSSVSTGNSEGCKEKYPDALFSSASSFPDTRSACGLEKEPGKTEMVEAERIVRLLWISRWLWISS